MNPWKLILLLSYAIFTAHTVAEPGEGVLKDFIARRHQQREARLLERQSAGLASRPVIKIKANEVSYDINWAGAVLTYPPSGKFNFVSAQWNLPTLSRPPSAYGAGEWSAAEWVGIDGDTCQSAILQAGTLSSVQVSSSGDMTTQTYIWYEWYPNPLIAISGFSVNLGDEVEFSITATSNASGTVLVKNLSKGTSTLFNVKAPDNYSVLCGINAEWILEDISSSSGLLPFACFTPVSFSNCKATTTTGETTDLTNAQLLEIQQLDVILATPTLISSTELQVSYG